MKKNTSFSIRIQLILLVLIPLIPATVIIVSNNLHQRNEAVRGAEKEAALLVQNLATQQERTAENTRRLLRMLVQMGDVKNRNVSACDTLFSSLIGMDSQYVSMMLIDTGGTVFASAHPSKTVNVADRKYFREAIRRKKFSVGEFSISRFTNTPAFHFAYPILDAQNNVTMVLAVGMNIEYIGKVFARSQMPEKTEVVFSDWRGIILYADPNMQQTGAREETGMMAAMQKENRPSGTFGGNDKSLESINSYQRLYLDATNELYMYVRVSMNKDIMLAGARRSMLFNLAVFAFVYLIALVTAWIFADNMIIRKIKLVVTAAQKIASGALDTVTGVPHSQGELGALSRSFEEMSGALQKRDREHEHVQTMLQEVGERYMMLFNHIPQPLIVMDAFTLRILTVNSAAVSRYGYTSEEFLQLTYRELIPDELVLRVLKASRQAQPDEEIVSGSQKHMRKNGEVVDVEVSYASITYRGIPSKMVSVTDITERVRGEKIQQALYKIYRASNMAGDLQELFGMIHHILGEIVPAQNFSIALHDAAQDTISYPYFVDEYEVTPLPQKSGRGLAAYVLRTGEPLIATQDTVQTLTMEGSIDSSLFAGLEWLGAPLKIDDRSIGLVALRSYDEAVRFKEKDKIFILFISSQIAKAIDRKRADDALRESERQLRRSQTSLSEAQALATLGSWHKDLKTGITSWSDTMFEIFGLSPKQPVPHSGEFYSIVHPEDVSAVRSATERTLTGAITHLDHRIVRYGADVRHVSTMMKPTFDHQHNVVEILGTILDITDRKEAEEQIRRSLHEKEVLLKEIHHRVKNNMQIISSLLSLQAASAIDPAAREVLNDSRQRVRSMALIHENLYQSENFSEVDLNEYLRGVVVHLFNSYDRDGITCSIAIEPLKLILDAAVPCGLIVNELVSNALKYAFPSGGPGSITVSIAKVGERKVLLEVVDDGIGIPPSINIDAVQTLGLQLVRSLVQQLQGTMTITCSGGTRVSIEFCY